MTINTATKKKSLLSPFRYPGGKTWLRPLIRLWLKNHVTTLVEAFGGGAIVSLTAVNEGLAKRAVITEKDPRVAAVWAAMLNGEAKWLCDRIMKFRPTRANVHREFKEQPRSLRKIAWMTLLQNRVSHGGLIAPGAGLLREGENGNGLWSRWYPDTLVERIGNIHSLKARIRFSEADALVWLARNGRRGHKGRTAYFIDPPYRKAGKRLYEYGEINHRKLFEIAARLRGRVLMTYDDSAEIREVTQEFGLN